MTLTCLILSYSVDGYRKINILRMLKKQKIPIELSHPHRLCDIELKPKNVMSTQSK